MKIFNNPLLTRREFAASAAAFALAPSFLPAAEAVLGLQAGAAETVITPTEPNLRLIGPMDLSTGVNDDLFARVLVLEENQVRTAIITLDALGFDIDYNDVLVAAVSKAGGIPPEHILIVSSHTHSAPMTIPWGRWERAKDKPWHTLLPEKLGEIAKQAVARLQPARLRYRREPTQVGFNRRFMTAGQIVMAPNPQGVVLPWVDVLAVESADGKPIGVLFCHAAHPVIIHSASRLISADFPGFAVKELRNTLGKDGVYLFAQGCGGNINGFPLRSGIQAAAGAGRDLGQAVARAARVKTDPLAAGPLKVASAELSLPLAAPAPAELARIAGEKNADGSPVRPKLLHVVEKGEPPTMRFPMRGVALGRELCILGLPHEMFAEYHLHVEKLSPFKHTLVFAYTNGCEGYIGTAKDYELGGRGGYETAPGEAARKYTTGLPLKAECETLIHAGVQELLQKLTPA